MAKTTNKKTPPVKSNRGGSRSGAGRPASYNEPTDTISFCVPISIIPDVTEYVNTRRDALRIPAIEPMEISAD
jgi:hypothetical protein